MRNDTLVRVLKMAKALRECEERPFAADLASRFGVSIRTVRRDVASLKKAGWRVPEPQGRT